MPCAVVLTALPVEYLAVRKFLTNLREVVNSQGTVYEQGVFAGEGFAWEVGIAEVGAGNAGAAIEAERAIGHFKPDVLLFVGIAGGLKDDVISTEQR
jgi:nucleoside phosphorylase